VKAEDKKEEKAVNNGTHKKESKDDMLRPVKRREYILEVIDSTLGLTVEGFSTNSSGGEQLIQPAASQISIGDQKFKI